MRTARTLALVATLPWYSALAAGAAEVVAGGNGGILSLGSHWGPYETYRNVSFRWVDNDAEIVLRGGTGETRVAIVCEGGPSLGRRSFPLRVLDAAGRQVDHIVCNGADRRAEMLLPVGASATRFSLHVDGGGRRVPGEQRILNFRVFSLDDELAAAGGRDVVDPRGGVRLGDGWYPLEHYRGQTFRWMAGDGRVFVTADRASRATLRLLLEVGPSLGSRVAPISVHDRHGTVLVRTTLKGRGIVTVPLQLEAGENEFVVRVASPNARVPSDPRILNLRLFDAAARR
jgi:hypothetical protein